MAIFREDVDSREVFYVRDERYIPDPIGIHEIPGIMAGEESLLYRFCKPVVLGCVTYDSEPDDYINLNAFEKLYDYASTYDAEVVRANYYINKGNKDTK